MLMNFSRSSKGEMLSITKCGALDVLQEQGGAGGQG